MQVQISRRIEFFSFFLLGLLFPAQERRLMLLCGAEIASFVHRVSGISPGTTGKPGESGTEAEYGQHEGQVP